MSLDATWSELAEAVMPAVFTAAGTDSVSVMRTSRTSDGKGGHEVSRSAVYTGLPCFLDATTTGGKAIDNERLTSRTKYKLSFPRVQNGALVVLRADDQLKVAARGLEPEKTFKILNILDTGIDWQVNCELI